MQQKNANSPLIYEGTVYIFPKDTLNIDFPTQKQSQKHLKKCFILILCQSIYKYSSESKIRSLLFASTCEGVFGVRHIQLQEAVSCVYERTLHVCECSEGSHWNELFRGESPLLIHGDWPRARTVLLLTTQEATLIHHKPFCSIPLSHPSPPQCFHANAGALQITPYHRLASHRSHQRP